MFCLKTRCPAALSEELSLMLLVSVLHDAANHLLPPSCWDRSDWLPECPGADDGLVRHVHSLLCLSHIYNYVNKVWVFCVRQPPCFPRGRGSFL